MEAEISLIAHELAKDIIESLNSGLVSAIVSNQLCITHYTNNYCISKYIGRSLGPYLKKSHYKEEVVC